MVESSYWLWVDCGDYWVGVSGICCPIYVYMLSSRSGVNWDLSASKAALFSRFSVSLNCQRLIIVEFWTFWGFFTIQTNILPIVSGMDNETSAAGVPDSPWPGWACSWQGGCSAPSVSSPGLFQGPGCRRPCNTLNLSWLKGLHANLKRFANQLYWNNGLFFKFWPFLTYG